MSEYTAVDTYLKKLKKGDQETKVEATIHHSDIADYLERTKRVDEDEFFVLFDTLPQRKRAKTFLELPTPFQVDLINHYDAKTLASLVKIAKSNDATDIFLSIIKTDQEKSEDVLALLSDTKKEEVLKLTHYDESEAGSLMQTELFKVKINDTVAYAIQKLAQLKKQGIGKFQCLFVTDADNKLLKNISMDDLILENTQSTFSEIMEKFPEPHVVSVHESTQNVLNMIEKYDLGVLAVVDKKGRLIGRITHDDALESMQESATQQLYNLSKIDADEELHEEFTKTGQTRAIWLSINLVNAIIASLVIGLFEETLKAVVALAVLMPIVANMAGTASVQTMTVMVRQMGLGEITFQDTRPILIKEINMAVLNGILFGFLSAGIAQLWFGNYQISLAIGLSMWVSFVSAGLLGASVPMLLKKVHLDPAVASSVIVITLIDIIGFFSFLWFSELIIF